MRASEAHYMGRHTGSRERKDKRKGKRRVAFWGEGEAPHAVIALRSGEGVSASIGRWTTPYKHELVTIRAGTEVTKAKVTVWLAQMHQAVCREFRQRDGAGR